MCGRFAFFSPREAITALFDVEFPLELEPRFNISPTQYVVALRQPQKNGNEYPAIEPALLRWGLIPSWSKDPRIGNRMINARAETVDKKPAFRSAFKRRRCVVLADGFFEWRRTDDGKIPYFISMNNRQPFAMAGLWERWSGGDSPIESCTIITTAANRAMTPLHERMPVILSVEFARRWIDAANNSTEALRSLLMHTDDDRLQYWEVSRSVNNSRNDGPELIKAS
jgi:putative SOS response-associated peptidase YedK